VRDQKHRCSPLATQMIWGYNGFTPVQNKIGQLFIFLFFFTLVIHKLFSFYFITVTHVTAHDRTCNTGSIPTQTVRAPHFSRSSNVINVHNLKPWVPKHEKGDPHYTTLPMYTLLEFSTWTTRRKQNTAYFTDKKEACLCKPSEPNCKYL